MLLLAPTIPGQAQASLVSLDTFAKLAAACAPSVAPETLAAIARTESGFDDTEVHDNATNRTYRPATRGEAIALSTELVIVDHHSVDLGLMQINSANLADLNLTITDAFDVCHNLTAGARILVAGYVAPAAGSDPQPAVLQALSRYNTGDPARGLVNGYVGRVQDSAEQVVPAIRLRGEPTGAAPVTARQPASPPPSWDVYAQARAARGQGLVFGHAQSVAAPGQPLNQQATSDAR